ncbi:MAG: hypothetical protein APF76_02275 [Desulfitibacter sp. BRH_c19]|nr:MAG: hypothetical protein APF76_02275 [Desulfitibacter sp. BRH_c19]
MKNSNFKLIVLVLIIFISISVVIATVMVQSKTSIDLDEYFTEPVEITTHLKPDEADGKLNHIKAVIVVGTAGRNTYEILSQNQPKLQEICINFFNELTEKQVNDLMKENELKDMLQLKIDNNLNTETTGVYFQEILTN